MKYIQGPNQLSTRPIVIEDIHRSAPLSGTMRSEAASQLVNLWSGWRLTVDTIRVEEHETCSFGSIVAALALEILASKRGLLERAGAMPSADEAIEHIWTECHDPSLASHAIEVSEVALRWALKAPSRTTEALTEAIRNEITKLLARCADEHPSYQTRILMLAAEKNGIPFFRSSMAGDAWQFGYGQRSRIFRYSQSECENQLAIRACSNKRISSRLIWELGYPCPEQFGSISESRTIRLAIELGEVVVKPASGGQGRGVTVRPAGDKEVRQAHQFAAANDDRVIIEQFVPGDDHRLLVINGRFIAAAKRQAAEVVGDGRLTIQELVEALNNSRSQSDVGRRYLKQINANDPGVIFQLRKQKLTLDTVLDSGQSAKLRSNSNISTGGIAQDYTRLVHPENIRMVEDLARDMLLVTAGFDYVTTDISKPWHETGGKIIEVNTIPGLDVHVIAGSEEHWIGEKALGDHIQAIPAAIIIGATCNQKIWREWRENAGMMPPLGMLPNLAIISEASLHLNGPRLAQQSEILVNITRATANRSVQAILVHCSEEWVDGNGLPLSGQCRIFVDQDIQNKVPQTDWMRAHDPNLEYVDATGDISSQLGSFISLIRKTSQSSADCNRVHEGSQSVIARIQ